MTESKEFPKLAAFTESVSAMHASTAEAAASMEKLAKVLRDSEQEDGA